MLLLAGMVHAAFEDWMFAVGSYPSVLFWSLAFVLTDLMPARAPMPRVAMAVVAPRFEQGFPTPLRSQ